MTKRLCITSAFLLMCVALPPSVVAADAPVMSWDEFRKTVVEFYIDNKIEGKFPDLQDKEVREIAPEFRGQRITGEATFRGLEKGVAPLGRIVQLSLVTPLEHPFTVTCRTDPQHADDWSKIGPGSRITFAGIVKMVGTGYVTIKSPFGGQEKRVQTIAIIVSSVRPQVEANE